MKFTLTQYAQNGHEAALAVLRRDTNAAGLRRQWAIHAMALENEYDRIFARDAYDRAYKQAMQSHAARRTA